MRRSTFATLRGAALVAAVAAWSGSATLIGGAQDPRVPPTQNAPTFNKDVAPIFHQKCVTCHRPAEIAPMSLITFKDVRPWARSIREKVVSREMPPWHADPAHGTFRNDRSLTQQEIDTIEKSTEKPAERRTFAAPTSLNIASAVFVSRSGRSGSRAQ